MAQGIRVVVADDEFLVRANAVRTLQNHNYQVIGEASNGAEAFEMTKAMKPDLTLLDIRMPEMDGLTATRLIQESCPTPVIILTAHESQDLFEQASAAGAGYYLVKPLDGAALARAVAISMARHADIMRLMHLSRELEEKNQQLERIINELHTLQGIIPICMYCKSIRDDEGAWGQMEKYISEHSNATFSHGICPSCLKERYGELE